MRLLLIFALSTAPLFANDVIELTKDEALEMMNLAFIAIAAEADAREAIGQSQVASKAYQDRLSKLMVNYGVSSETHKLDRLTGILEPIGLEVEEEVEEPQEDDEETTP